MVISSYVLIFVRFIHNLATSAILLVCLLVASTVSHNPFCKVGYPRRSEKRQQYWSTTYEYLWIGHILREQETQCVPQKVIVTNRCFREFTNSSLNARHSIDSKTANKFHRTKLASTSPYKLLFYTLTKAIPCFCRWIDVLHLRVLVPGDRAQFHYLVDLLYSPYARSKMLTGYKSE